MERVGDIELCLSEGDLLTSTAKLHDRLVQITTALYNEGIIMPQRSVSIESIDPFKMRIGYLDGETVRKIYEAHKLCMSGRSAARYSGVSPRTVMNYWGMKGLRPYSFTLRQNIADKIVEAHEKGLTACETAVYAGADIMTVYRELKRNNLPRNPGKTCKLGDDKIANIVDVYGRTEGNLTRAKGITSYSRPTIAKYWRMHGLEPKR